MEKKTGIIKNINSERGFGFITDTEGKDHFFHCTRVLDKKFDSLVKGDKVEFSIGDNKGKEVAVNVKIIK